MSRVKILSLCLVATALSVGPGCSSRRAVLFGTHTKFAFDVTTSAEGSPQLNLGYDREEIAIVPRSSTGESYSVAGQFDAELNQNGGLAVHEIFATGKAANVAVAETEAKRKTASDTALESMPSGDATAAKSNPDTATPDKDTSKDSFSELPMVVVTGTTVGLKGEMGGTTAKPPTGTFGYKRTTLTYIPVKEGESEVRSVYADISIHRNVTGFDTDIELAKAKTTSGLRLRQRIATGKAAVILAGSDDKVREVVTATTAEDAIKASATSGNIITLFDALPNKAKKDEAKTYINTTYPSAVTWTENDDKEPAIDIIITTSATKLAGIKSYLENLK